MTVHRLQNHFAPVQFQEIHSRKDQKALLEREENQRRYLPPYLGLKARGSTLNFGQDEALDLLVASSSSIETGRERVRTLGVGTVI